MTIKWLGTITVNDLVFRKGDNGEQLFYEAESGGLAYNVVRPHIADPVLPGTEPPQDERRHVPYWFAYAERDGALKLLNALSVGLGSDESKGPLCDATDSGYDDPPTRLLLAIAELVRQGADPWIERGGL